MSKVKGCNRRAENAGIPKMFTCRVCTVEMLRSFKRPWQWPVHVDVCVSCTLFWGRHSKKRIIPPACLPGTCILGLQGEKKCPPCRMHQCLAAQNEVEEDHREQEIQRLRERVRELEEENEVLSAGLEATESILREERRRREVAEAKLRIGQRTNTLGSEEMDISP